MTTFLKKTLPVMATALVLWAILAFTQKEFLFKNGELSLFLFDWTFLKESFMIPGGFLGWAGSFFTQFLLIPWLGALLWVLLLTAAGIATAHVFDIPAKIAPLAILPVALLIIANMSLGYGVFIMRIQDYFFAPTLGYLLILAIAGATWRAPMTWQKIAILTVSAFAGYVLAGIFALTGVIAAGLGLAVTSKGWKRIAAPGFSILLFIVAPLILYGLFTRYRLSDSWCMALPTITDNAWMTHIRLPYWLLLGLSVCFALLHPLFAKAANNDRNHMTFHIAVAAIAICAVAVFWFKDTNFKTELKMSIAADRSDWKQVTDIYYNASMRNVEKEKKLFQKRQEKLKGIQDKDTYDTILEQYDAKIFQPTRLMVILRDLALFKQDKALDMSFTMRDGGRKQKSLTQVPMVIQAGRIIYLNYGLINQEYRWCLEDQVEYGWSFCTMKYMAMHAIIMNEPEFAAKYLDKLDKTIFYRKWSRFQRTLANDATAMSKATPYKEALKLMSFDDRMSNDRVKLETYLMSHFIADRDAQATHQFDCASLLWAMRSQDIEQFWKALSQYIETAPELKLPRSVQEAIVLYSSLEKEDIGIPIDRAVVESYASFQKYVQQTKYRSQQEAAFPMWLKFGNTFYYYYYFIRNMQTF